MINNIKIEIKFWGGVIFIILLAEAIGVYAFLNLSNLEGKLYQISNVELPAVINLRNIQKEVNYLAACERDLDLDIIFGKERLRKELFKSVADSWGRLEKNWTEYEKLLKGDDEKKLWDEFVVKFGLWKILFSGEISATAGLP